MGHQRLEATAVWKPGHQTHLVAKSLAQLVRDEKNGWEKVCWTYKRQLQRDTKEHFERGKNHTIKLNWYMYC